MTDLYLFLEILVYLCLGDLTKPADSIENEYPFALDVAGGTACVLLLW